MARPPKVSPADRAEVMTAKEVRTALRVSAATFARHSAAGDYTRFECKPRIGLPRYSRRLVEDYLAGQPVYDTAVFGAKRKRAS